MKWKQPIQHILRDLLFIGAGIQIILGLIWLTCNLTGAQRFPNAALFGEQSENVLWDTYYGFVYPAFLWGVQRVTGFLGITWYSIVYLMQLGFSFFAVFSFVRIFFSKTFLSVWFTLGIMTLPAMMQVNLAIIPEAIVFSLYLFMIGIGIKAFREGRQTRWVALLPMGGLWFLAAMLQPDYGIVGATVLLIFLLCQWREKKHLLVVYLLLFCVIMGAVQVTERIDSQAAPSKSIGLRLVSRFTWPNIETARESWTADMYDRYDWNAIQLINGEADSIFTEFGPGCRELLGDDDAENIFLHIAKDAVMNRTSAIVKDILWDSACYILAPTMLYFQLQGMGYPSYSGQNYDFMRMYTPGLTKIYVTYTAFWFMAEITLALLLLLAVREKKRLSQKEVVFLLSNALLLLGIFVFRGAGVMDYKIGLFFPVLWMLFIDRAID